MTGQRNVATAILDQLAAWGVKNIYGLVGDDIFHLMDALAQRQDIVFYHVKHEESAAMMASAQAKLNSEPGVCLADGGPGTLHLLNGLADAFMDNVPVLAITGQVARRDIGTNTKQYFDQQSMLRPIVSYTSLLGEAAGAAQVLENAYAAAVAGSSVAHVSVPLDVLPLPCNEGIVPAKPYFNTFPASSPGVVQEALELMRKSRRPVILAGAGARRAGQAIAGLSLRWGAAVINTLAGSGVVGRSHPLYVGGLGQAGSPAATRLLGLADLCLIVGANWWPSDYVPGNIAILQIDCHPASIGSTTGVSFGLVGDAADMVSRLCEGINTEPDQAWLDLIKAETESWLNELAAETGTRGSPVHPAALMRAIQNTLPDDAIICLDTGDNTVWFGRAFRPTAQNVLVSGKWRTMGYALPAALAAKINRPGQKVLALAGDGGFAMTMPEFLTAVRYRLPVTVVVMNNGSLAMEKNKMIAGGLAPVGTDIVNPDFARYAADCGGIGLKVEHSSELEPALQAALNSDRPALVDVKTADIAVPGTKMPH